ncbi:MAG TPA: transcription termination factor Rho, partial [Gemmatimonadaceae bacterium]|nr:transcription termination factor Rho [Gemmatimonadaceae bacterium]
MDTASLRRLPEAELRALAERLDLAPSPTIAHGDLLLRVEKALLASGETLIAEGTLELVKGGNGYLRQAAHSYLAGPDDVHVSPAQVKRFGLRTGDVVRGAVRPAKPWEKFLALAQVESVNGAAPEAAIARGNFDALRPKYP